MSSFTGFEANFTPETNGDHVMWMKGCDGAKHAIRRDSITWRDGETIAGIPISTEVIGPCDGSCQGKDRVGFFHDA